MPALLDVLAAKRVKATFFTTGDVASRYPAVIRRIVDDGHELACHGMTHRAFTELGRDAARAEIEESASILRQFGTVTSFRAPYLKFPSAYLDLLDANGFTLDSSHAVYKAAYYRDRAPRRLSRRNSERRSERSEAPQRGIISQITRVPASVMSSVLRLPSWIRDLNLALVSDPLVLFVHPWEFVDLRRERLRLDCRFKTGDIALACVADVLDKYTRAGARFVTMRDLA